MTPVTLPARPEERNSMLRDGHRAIVAGRADAAPAVLHARVSGLAAILVMHRRCGAVGSRALPASAAVRRTAKLRRCSIVEPETRFR